MKQFLFFIFCCCTITSAQTTTQSFPLVLPNGATGNVTVVVNQPQFTGPVCLPGTTLSCVANPTPVPVPVPVPPPTPVSSIPANAVPVTACQTLSKAGAYYVLQADLTCSFAITGDNITFDLNGHTVTFTTLPAVMDCPSGSKTLNGQCKGSANSPHITNSTPNSGGLFQSVTGSIGIPALYVGSEDQWGATPKPGEIDHLSINVSTIASTGIRLSYAGDGWNIHNNHISSTVQSIIKPGQTAYQARSVFQGVMIFAGQGPSTVGTGNVYTNNTIYGAPQGGIVDFFSNTQYSHNSILQQNSIASNDYCITSLGQHGQNIDGNDCQGMSRGYDIEGNNFQFNNNSANIYTSNKNLEYNGCELSGGFALRVRFQPQDVNAPPTGTINNNKLVSTATYCPAVALRFTSLSGNSQLTINNNIFQTISGTGGNDYALSVDGSNGVKLIGTNNSFTASYGIGVDYDGASLTVPLGQTWNVSKALVYNGNGANDNGNHTDDGSVVNKQTPFVQNLIVLDKPTNSLVICGGVAGGMVTVGGVVTTCGK